MSGNTHDRNRNFGESNNNSMDSGFSVTSDPLYQLTTRSVGRQLPQRHIFDPHFRTTRPQLITGANTEAQTNGRVYLQRRRFSDDLNLEYLRSSTANLDARPIRRNSFTETRTRTMRVLPFQLSTLQEMSPNVQVEDAPRFEVRQSIDVKDQKYHKIKMTKKYLSTVYALCYCIFLIVFSCIIFIGDAVQGLHPVPEIYCMILLVTGLGYQIFLFIRVRQHVLQNHKIAKNKEDRRLEFEHRLSEQTFEAIKTGQPLNDTTIDLPDYSDIEIHNHNYCFLTGRHGEFFYIKIGAAWFCLGLIIHSILFICYHTLFLISDDPSLVKCSSFTTLSLEILLPLYSIFNLYFIFKYCNLIINEFRGLARFGLMHSIATAMSFWIYTIVRETTDALYMKEHSKKGQFWIEDIEETESRESVPITACPGPDALNTVFEHFTPYLYPFIIEFCILMAGIYFMMWSNISKCPRKEGCSDPLIYGSEQFFEFHDLVPTHHTQEDGTVSFSETLRNRSAHETNNQRNNVIYLDCQGANRGVFASMLLIVGTVVTIIVLFIAVSEKKYEDIGLAISSVYEIIVLTIMLITTILAYIQTSKLDIVDHKVSYLDDVLLFIAVPAFMSQTIFTLIPAIKNKTYLTIISVLIELSQILVQTPWLIDGLRRCANSVENLRKKPGRALVTFMIGANITLWMFSTFSVKNAPSRDERYDFYGDVAWTILSHLMTPLIMFYRFHSSVCLVDVWKNSYEPNSH